MSKTNGNGHKPNTSVLYTLPVSAWEWPRVAVFIPYPIAMPEPAEVLPHIIEIARTGVNFLYHQHDRQDVVRNRIAEQLLKSNYTHVLMLDSDHKHPVDIVQRMARWGIQDPKRLVIGGLYFNRRPPFEPCAWGKGEDGSMERLIDWQQGLVHGIELCGTAVMLIAREVFEQVERPWFFYDYQYYPDMKEDFMFPTEDIGFCKKVRAAGIEIYLDTTIDAPHGRTDWVTEKTYRTFAQMAQQMTEAKNESPELVEV